MHSGSEESVPDSCYHSPDGSALLFGGTAQKKEARNMRKDVSHPGKLSVVIVTVRQSKHRQAKAFSVSTVKHLLCSRGS